jgi:ferric-dicitrate binding protein FerR (iron transport regulator)
MAVSYLGDKNLVVEWTASDRANRAAFESRERLLSEANQRPLREALDPIRLAYRRAPLASKAQLLADVVAYIVRNS